MIPNDHYTYRVTWFAEDEEYIGLCAEFPSLSWLAASPEEALAGIRQVVADVVTDLEASGESVPAPFSTRPYSGKFMVRVPPEVHRKLAIEAGDTALRLARYFGVSSRFWLGLQADYDLDMAAEALGDRLEREVRVHAAA